MSELDIIGQLGHDADLLTRSDEWLENHRRLLAGEMNALAEELDTVLRAKQIKAKLQQRNLVAVQELEHEDGLLKDVVIRIMPLPDALESIKHQPTAVDGALAIAQLHGWASDGHDIATSATLRNAG